MKKSLRARQALAVGVMLSAGLLAAAPTSQATESHTDTALRLSQPPEGGPLPSARMLRQIPLVRAADQLRAALDHVDQSGFAGITLEDNNVALWWKGDLPASMHAAVAQASKTAAIRVAPARYSLSELQSAAAEVRKQIDGNAVGLIYAVKLPGDGSGLVLSAREEAGATTFAAEQEQRVGVAVKTVVEEPLKPISRNDDWAPWKGGAVMVNTTAGTACSSGFGVRNGANQHFVLTAGHCGQSGDRYVDGTGEYIGNVGARNGTHDIELVPVSSADHYLYVGNRGSNAALRVDGWGDTYVGQYLCQSGITSAAEIGGPVCNLKVLFFYSDPEDLVEAEQVDGQTAARPGDSGGPVYGPSASGGAIANGTNTRVAGNRLGFQDFRTASRDFGVYIP